jgi:O-methyltransferase
VTVPLLVKRAVRPALATVFAKRSRADLMLRAVHYPRFAEWCLAHSCVKVPGTHYNDRNRYFEQVLSLAELTTDIDYLEFGVYKGHSIRWWSEHNLAPRSRFVGFDSFEGLPETVGDTWYAGRFSTSGAIPVIKDDRVSFEVGWFHRTLPGFLAGFQRRSRVVVHLDSDIYSSTAFVLAHIGGILRPHDVLMFDEFSDSIHEFRAFQEFVSFFGIDVRAVAQQAGFERTALIVQSIR